MDIKYVGGNFVKDVVIQQIFSEFREDILAKEIELYKEQANQFAELPIINIRLRRVDQDRGLLKNDMFRLYMFDITCLPPHKEDRKKVSNFNEILDEMAHRLLIALRQIKIPYYDKINNEIVEFESTIKPNSLYTSKDVSSLTVFASYRVRVEESNLDVEKIKGYEFNLYTKEVE